jgi:hypothetical protein
MDKAQDIVKIDGGMCGEQIDTSEMYWGHLSAEGNQVYHINPYGDIQLVGESALTPAFEHETGTFRLEHARHCLDIKYLDGRVIEVTRINSLGEKSITYPRPAAQRPLFAMFKAEEPKHDEDDEALTDTVTSIADSMSQLASLGRDEPPVGGGGTFGGGGASGSFDSVPGGASDNAPGENAGNPGDSGSESGGGDADA